MYRGYSENNPVCVLNNGICLIVNYIPAESIVCSRVVSRRWITQVFVCRSFILASVPANNHSIRTQSLNIRYSVWYKISSRATEGTAAGVLVFVYQMFWWYFPEILKTSHTRTKVSNCRIVWVTINVAEVLNRLNNRAYLLRSFCRISFWSRDLKYFHEIYECAINERSENMLIVVIQCKRCALATVIVSKS